jgi:hypothetical protein
MMATQRCDLDLLQWWVVCTCGAFCLVLVAENSTAQRFIMHLLQAPWCLSAPLSPGIKDTNWECA